jgi:serine/threonine protein kinase/WD40 repeat protein
MGSQFSGKYQLFDQLAEEFAERIRRGERPPLQEYVERYPELAAEIHELFPAMVEIEVAETSVVSETAPPLRQIGDYRIVRTIGQGGMGVVYEAEQFSLRRRVALKVLPSHIARDATGAERFRREARAAARLHHTNIVPVFEVGQSEGTFFYAMQFIPGQSLAQVILELRRLRQSSGQNHSKTLVQRTEPTDCGRELALSLMTGRFIGGDAGVREESGTSSDNTAVAAQQSTQVSALLRGQTELSSVHSARRHYFESVARIGQQIAGALSYAHGRGIIHRDVKPSNLLLDASGVVWVTDFGLAKTEDDCLTETGDLVGTFRYMAPERFRGKCDARADNYALGLTLYELLVLRPGFDSPDRAQLVRLVQEEEPPRPRSIDPRVPRDLETIVIKAIAKDPARRYRTAEEMGEDLRRFLNGEAIHARRTSTFEQCRLWCRRNPAMSGLFGMLLVMVVSAFLTSFYLNGLLRQSELDRHEKVKAEQQAVESLFTSYVTQADSRRLSHQIGQRYETLEAIKKALKIARERNFPPERFDRLRTIAIAALALPDIRKIEDWAPYGDEYTDQFHSDAANRVVAFALLSGDIVVCRTEDRAEIARVQARGKNVQLSSDGRFLLAWGNHRFCVWSLESSVPRLVISEGEENGVPLFQADSRHLLVCRRDNSLVLLDLFDQEQERRLLVRSEDQITAMAFDSNGKQLLVTINSAAHVLDIASGNLVTVGPASKCHHACWHPNNRYVALHIDPNAIEIWDTENNQRLSVMEGVMAGGIQIKFTPDGELLVSCGWEAKIRVWQFRTGKQLLEYPRAYNIRFGADGRCIFGSGRHLITAEFATGRDCRTLGTSSRLKGLVVLRCASVHPDGRLLVVVSTVGIHYWDLVTGEEILWTRKPNTYWATFTSYDELLILSGTGMESMKVRIENANDIIFHVGPTKWLKGGSYAECAFSQDGKTIVQPMFPSEGISLFTHKGDGWTDRLMLPSVLTNGTAVSPDGSMVITMPHHENRVRRAWDSTMRIWRSDDGQKLTEFDIGEQVAAAFSPDNKRVVLTSREMSRLIPVDNWEQSIPLDDAGTNGPLLFSPGGDLFAAETGDGVIQFFDAETGAKRARFESPYPNKSPSLTFSPDGARFITMDREEVAVRIWDLRLIHKELSELGLEWAKASFAVARDADDRPKPRLRVELDPMLTKK